MSRTALEKIRKNHFGDGRFPRAAAANEGYAAEIPDKSRSIFNLEFCGRCRQFIAIIRY